MDFSSFAQEMLPFWMLGAFMFTAILQSDYKSILKFIPKSFFKFACYVALITVWRVYSLSYMMRHGADMSGYDIAKTLPIGAVFFTPWEDLCHTVPLVLLRQFTGESKWLRPINWVATLVVMLEFSSGHIYQGALAAVLL